VGSEDKMQHILPCVRTGTRRNSNVSLFLGEKKRCRLSLLLITLSQVTLFFPLWRVWYRRQKLTTTQKKRKRNRSFLSVDRLRNKREGKQRTASSVYLLCFCGPGLWNLSTCLQVVELTRIAVRGTGDTVGGEKAERTEQEGAVY